MDEKRVEFWIKAFKRNKHALTALDIETTCRNGPTAVLTIARMNLNGTLCTKQFIRDANLSEHSILKELNESKILLTYNGLKHDLPTILKEHPNAIPKHLLFFDLYQFAKHIGLNTKLKVLEKTFGIKRRTTINYNTHRLWSKALNGNKQALIQLLEYNEEDAKNLIYLAEHLVNLAEEKLSAKKWRVHRLLNAIEGSIH